MRSEEPIYNRNKSAERLVSAPPTSHIHGVNAILPFALLSCALGSGSDTSDDNGFQHGVSEAPITVQHLTWEANVFGGNEFST